VKQSKFVTSFSVQLRSFWCVLAMDFTNKVLLCYLCSLWQCSCSLNDLYSFKLLNLFFWCSLLPKQFKSNTDWFNYLANVGCASNQSLCFWNTIKSCCSKKYLSEKMTNRLRGSQTLSNVKSVDLLTTCVVFNLHALRKHRKRMRQRIWFVQILSCEVSKRGITRISPKSQLVGSHACPLK